MAIEITIPRLGWSMEEGTFVGWLKKDGDFVQAGTPLFSLEGEKAAQDIESVDSGILQIPKTSPKQGELVKVGQVIGYLSAKGAESEVTDGPVSKDSIVNESSPPPKLDGQPTTRKVDGSTPVVHQPSEAVTRLAISPRARRRALELGVDVAQLTASRGSGRIVEADVLRKTEIANASGPSIMRRTIAQRTAASFASIPHFYLGCELDATELVRLREDLLAEAEAAGVRLTLGDLILRAQALALRAHPKGNAIWQDNSVVQLTNCDVGLVVGLPDGLLVPIVRSADKGDLATLSKQRVKLVEEARAGRLSAEAMQGGATSLSNLGTTRVDEFSAVIAAPQSSMLAVGRAALRPYAFKERVALRNTIRLRLSVDHRVLDGGPAAEFLGAIVDLLENPSRLV